ncbi:MAG: class I SAM-dependent methyltransferase [Phenylobacterium sp.]|uniref:class I SAM-dependent methyltransferase n=1 Tax=Phenylobacterium sp. TaxID=1871053 RepID=UPI002719E0F4|nr:class I SAM-dependent methyltransferase [Phenylobacterium sp.]MDO8910389.1 class I SAM-dependent methyltransferase [Phenylobacterium sp.]MDP3102368.1 class I SAM-dependent methyltransferase [Phenylobacterium sp.]HQT52060.1 class I SAM-dependent methyltransferase [Phenylobacterium sp.]
MAAEHANRNPHGHMWLMAVVGVAAGLALMVFAPRLAVVSNSLLLFAGFHIVGGVVVLSTLFVSGLSNRLPRLTGAARSARAYDFGWGPGWMNGLAIAALITLAAAVLLQLTRPGTWPLAFALVGLSALLLVGNAVMRGFRRTDHVVLPMVDLLSSDHDLVLDAGCGSGRTTIALARTLKSGRVVAFDRFDAGYIDGGGRALLDNNLKVADLTGRVDIVSGDLTAMAFADNHFDAAVSTHVYDHLGSGKAGALSETLRVLRPGGRFLMAVWVPGLAMFAVGNVLSLFLTSKARWRALAANAGFQVIDEGMFNHTWFVLLEKPRA